MSPFNAKIFLKTLTTSPGIYQMINAKGQVLYVGKARNLKKRVSSYFRSQQNLKTASLVKQIATVETIVTQTENEALLLENNLIKKFKPRYNILFRDDKSYPYLYLSDHKDYPRLNLYRGAKHAKGRYFGPYPSVNAVRESLILLEKIFRIRSCQDEFFRSRTRPCLQYQIQRCTAPCVGLIDPQSYQEDVRRTVLFLEGKSQEVIEELVERMEAAATKLEFEKAARLRDEIASLRQTQQQQGVSTVQDSDVDALAFLVRENTACIQVMTIRGGRLLGGKSYFPSLPLLADVKEIIPAFIGHYYLSEDSKHEIPKQILFNHKPDDHLVLLEALSKKANHPVQLGFHPRGLRARWLQLAIRNATENLASHLASQSTITQRLIVLQESLKLPNMPQRLECFDISHSSGEATVASCVVFDEQGARKSDYRRFNIEGITKGDDYAAMRQALLRRYSRLKTEEAVLPDLLIIDGGKGQLKQAEEIMEELQISGVTLLGIAKGVTRKPGMETLFLSSVSEPIDMQPDCIGLHLLQQIRDEAHRFAITGHRGRRAKTRTTSTLETIPNVGAKRRRELLKQFGGLQELKRASAEDIAKVSGISKALAEKIYFALRR